MTDLCRADRRRQRKAPEDRPAPEQADSTGRSGAATPRILDSIPGARLGAACGALIAAQGKRPQEEQTLAGGPPGKGKGGARA
ncbi:hypothetical protein NDU88_008023 [Pleurodeles waltl]|uniref:Uncharacterized protein n=1 Tax=Pleurodeles waltl TaxID=8319 RepID=A0AAV7QTH4_PLEWA|nr:hypothetical protein NDU88_008023 [Pleurodeles waltl]